jgi:hypothetical protein
LTDLPPSFAPVGFAWETLKDQGINRLRIAGAEELLGAGGALIDGTGRSRLKGARFLLTAQATRAQHTFETVIAAARMGRGVQAAMLNRALLDDVLDIHWTAAHPDDAPERADKHDRMIALAEHHFEDKFRRADRSLTDEERKELKRLMRLYGGGSRAFKAPWHRTSFEECYALVKARWKDEPGADYYLDYIYEVIQRRNNLLLHGSPTAYRQTVVTDAAGRRHLNRAGPDRLWPESLAQGAGGYYFVCRVLAREFGFDKEPMAEVFSRATGYCRKIEDLPELSALPDDAPCPCNSGRTVAQCHGS